MFGCLDAPVLFFEMSLFALCIYLSGGRAEPSQLTANAVAFLSYPWVAPLAPEKALLIFAGLCLVAAVATASAWSHEAATVHRYGRCGATRGNA